MPGIGIHIKALVLLIVFTLNTVVAFACSLGGYFHSLHHRSHSMQHEVLENHHSEDHSHDANTASHEHHESAPDKKMEDCCSKNVVEFEKIDKSVSRTVEVPISIFVTSFFYNFYTPYSLLFVRDKTFLNNHVRRRSTSTIPDLRIVIQSFQI